MQAVSKFLFRTRGHGGKLTILDALAYLYLGLGTILMFGPVLWVVMSSFKPQSQLDEFPPRFLPYQPQTVLVEGYEDPLPLFDVAIRDTERVAIIEQTETDATIVDVNDPTQQQTVPLDNLIISRRTVEVEGFEEELPRADLILSETYRTMVQTDLAGAIATMIDPNNPAEEPIRVNINNLEAREYVAFSLDNYQRGIEGFDFVIYLGNSVFVTVTATLLTLLINSMAAFALSKYQFRGRNTIFLIIISTLMVPVSVILVPIYQLITSIGWNNTLIGVIVPGAATPTGVFLLRQYMLTIPDELIEAARIDGASEWRIYLQIMLPLSAPALAVLAIFSVMWRWNDFLWPFIVLSRSELFTLQVGLQSFESDYTTQWDLILAMTVLTLLPITLVFAFLQRYITSGIATTGMK